MDQLKSKKVNIFFRPLKISRLTWIILIIIFGVSGLVSIFNFVLLINYNHKLNNYQATLEASSSVANNISKTDKVTNPNSQVPNYLIDNLGSSVLDPTAKSTQIPVYDSSTVLVLPTAPSSVINNIVEAISNLMGNVDESVELIAVTATPTIKVVTVLNSFGDGFSGLSFIDKTKTTMSWDENSTAFTFPPVYTFTKNDQIIHLTNNSSTALKVLNNELYYLGNKLKLPPELQKENILNIRVSLIGSKWLVGIVSGKSFDERAWVYFFDGQNFSPIITQTSTYKIEPRFSRLGGTIAFGGSEDNFLIIYSGYDGRVFYYYKGALTDVSNFFGLRVSAGGFEPQIVSRENSRGTLFYICSKTENKSKLIKFWPQQKGKLMGSLDFSPLIFSDIYGVKNTSCEFKGEDLLINIKKTDDSLETWIFKDKGFDNSQNREVVSSDLGQNRNPKIKSAIISEFDMLSDEGQAELFFSNDGGKWQKIIPYVWQELNAPNTSLFWRVIFKAEPGRPDYSPWFDNINRLDYKTF